MKSALDRIEGALEPIADRDVISQLAGYHQDPKLTEEERRGAWAEFSAFNFYESRSDDGSVWGTYFGPLFITSQADGQEIMSPDARSDFDLEHVGHWENRARESGHPVLAARYADLVWDLKELITGEKPRSEFAQKAIDNYLRAVSQKLYKQTFDGKRFLVRALTLAISLNDTARIASVRDAVFDFYDGVAVPKLPGTWPFLFDNCYGNKRVPLLPGQEEKIIASLEDILTTCSNPEDRENFNAFSCQAAADRLARHYERRHDTEARRRVTRAAGLAMEALASQSDPLSAMMQLQPVVERYRNFGMGVDEKRALILLESMGKKAKDSMQSVRLSLPIEQGEIENMMEAITSGTSEETLHRLGANFVPSVSDTKNLLEDIKRDCPFLSLFGVAAVSDSGIVGNAGSLEADPEGRLYLQIAESMGLSSHFLAWAIDAALSRHSIEEEQIVKFLFLSPVYSIGQSGFLKEGVAAYLRQDYVKAIHVLIPQIECAIRNILHSIEVPTTKIVRGNSQLKNLNDMLREPTLEAVLPEDLRMYLRVLLSDQRGWNLRNTVCHGLLPFEQFERGYADRVLHCLLTLACLREADNDSPQEG